MEGDEHYNTCPKLTKHAAVFTVTVPAASAGQAMAAMSPAGVFFHTTSPVFSSRQISWGSFKLKGEAEG